MGGLQKLGMGVIAIGMATTLLLPGRQTPAVANSFFNGVRGVLATAMGTGKKV